MDESLDFADDERRYWLALSMCNGIGPVTFQKLLHHFGSAKNVWQADVNALGASGIGEKLLGELITFKKEFVISSYEQKMHKAGVSYLAIQDKEYPELLKQIKKPPPVLYQKGTFHFNRNERLVSVVGTRKITEYGREVTELLVRDLVASGCVIVSGLAFGVDAVAAQTAIAAGGITIAVLGSGVDICTPEENHGLYEQILESGGAIISEYPLGTMPNKGSFPARNRIIAGLSLGVVVTEGAADSGSLITANDAFENSRKVFAVPGPITSSVSKGPISLIAKGAKMVITASDIINELGIHSASSGQVMNQESRIKGTAKKIVDATKEEQKILDLLQDHYLHFDEIVKRTGLNSSKLGILLSLMEIKGLIKNTDGGYKANIIS